jgi:hypothetical protein
MEVPFWNTVYEVIVQFAGSAGAVQFKVAPAAVTFEAAKPVGAPVAAVQVVPPGVQGPTSDHRAGTLGGCQLGAAEASGWMAFQLSPPKETICPVVTDMPACQGAAQAVCATAGAGTSTIRERLITENSSNVRFIKSSLVI